MPEARRFTKVFIASPGDLVDERRTARAVIEEYNNTLASFFQCHIELVGWEDTLPGVGRPQAIINRDLDGCDLFVGMLWKRWGTPPGTEDYTSGFEEEFRRSIDRNLKEGRPEIQLFFKEVEAELLADPGDQLKKVIKFKEEIFSGKNLLVGSFADSRDFESKFRKCICRYAGGLATKDRARESQEVQSPNAGENAAGIVPSQATPLGVEGARFLRAFLSRAEKATESNSLAADDVARVRLLSLVAGVQGNDQQSLGPHNANLLFGERAKHDFGQRELCVLVQDALIHFSDENVPLWHWLKSVDSFRLNLLPLFTLYGATEQRVGALKAMRLIAEPVHDNSARSREAVVEGWFTDLADAASRTAALEYLSDYGLLSDLPIIEREFQRNDSQTANAAAEAIIRITLNDDSRAAQLALHVLQPSVLNADLVDALFSAEMGIDDDLLQRGLGHRNPLIRRKSAERLRERGELDVALAEPLLEDSDAEVRLEALLALVSSGHSYTLARARDVLVDDYPTNADAGLIALSRRRARNNGGAAAFERFTEAFYNGLTDSQLEDLAKESIFEQGAYFSLIRRHFNRRGNELRTAVENKFLDRFEVLMDNLPRAHLPPTFHDEMRALSQNLRNKFTRGGLTLICKQLNPVDLPLVRSTMADGSVDYSVEDVRYLAKCGQWRDVPLIISSLEKPGSDLPAMAIFFAESRYGDAARAMLSLGKDRVSDLLTTPMPGTLLARVVLLIPDKAFRRLKEAEILRLLRSDHERVRRTASIKYVKTFPRQSASRLLSEYVSQAPLYYNVIYWLDCGISVPRSRVGRIAVNALLR